MVTKNKRLMGILFTAAVLLLIPLIAMQFTKEVVWTPGDFAVMAFLLFGTSLLCELVLRRIKKISYRIVLCGAVVVGFILIWVELAVGIFGTPLAGN